MLRRAWHLSHRDRCLGKEIVQNLFALRFANGGDPTFFARADEVEAAWEIVQPGIDRWEAERPTDFPNYQAGSALPAEPDGLPT